MTAAQPLNATPALTSAVRPATAQGVQRLGIRNVSLGVARVILEDATRFPM